MENSLTVTSPGLRWVGSHDCHMISAKNHVTSEKIA